MNAHERFHRMLLLAYPRQHRQDFGEPMLQLMRDRIRDEGGGVRTLRLWGDLVVDVARTAPIERVAGLRIMFRSGWWRLAAVLIAVIVGWAGVDGLFEPATGPWYKYTFGRAALLASPLLIVVGLVVRGRHRRNGSAMVAAGLLPGAAATLLFWYPPFLLFGLFSIVVLVAAINDADHAKRYASVAPTATN